MARFEKRCEVLLSCLDIVKQPSLRLLPQTDQGQEHKKFPHHFFIFVRLRKMCLEETIKEGKYGNIPRPNNRGACKETFLAPSCMRISFISLGTYELLLVWRQFKRCCIQATSSQSIIPKHCLSWTKFSRKVHQRIKAVWTQANHKWYNLIHRWLWFH